MKTKFSTRALSLFLSLLMVITTLPIVSFSSAIDADAATSGYALEEAYTAEYADPNNSNAITKLADPVYRNSFSDPSLADFSVTKGADVASVGERTHALHLNASTANPGNYATLASNPLAGINLSETGATLMAWNYYTLDKTDVDFVPMVTFYGVPSAYLLSKYGLNSYLDSTNNDDDYWYVSFTLGGYILLSKGAIDGDSSHTNYVDYKIDATSDIVGIPYTSTTVTTKNTEVWTHYAFTVDANAIKFYCGGVEYTFSTSMGAMYDTSQAEDFRYLLDYMSDSNTKVSYGYGLKYWHNDADTYLDDIRVYDFCLTQQQIRSVYGEGDDYSLYKYAEGHDPTIVYNETKKAGEFDYYMFGTGMTIYGSNDLANWYELADSKGRTGYQSEKLFGGNYRTVLGSGGTNLSSKGGYMPLAYSAGGSSITNDSIGTGAGLMVWAPSVLYNKSTGKWQMFAATSSWGSNVSCIFVAESDSIEGPYSDIYTIIYSGFHDNCATNGYANVDKYNSDHRTYLNYKYEFPSYKYFYNASTYPNCIDAAPFYGADGNLYMSYGSWSGGIWLVKLTADGRYLDNGNLSGADAYYGVKIAATSQESNVDGVSGSAEGSFIYYDPESKYYYLTVVYGAVHNYRYTMRVWRSASVTGPYTDATGTASTTASTNDSRSGMKLMGNYNFTGTGTQYYDNGHSSNLIVPSTSGTNEAGKSFIAYHVRMYDGYRTERSYASTNYLNEARVHQVVLNQDGWQCILPYQYSGETFGDDGFVYSMNNLTGTWSFLLHNETIDSSFKTTSSIMLKSDGTVSGNYSGTWQLVMDGTKPYLNMTLNISGKAVTFKGVFVTMTNELGELTTTLSAAGETEGYKTIAWGAMQEALKPASSASDSDLIMMSDDGYDNIIYTHGTNNNGNYGAGSSSDYMWFGDIISDGTVPPTGHATYNYSAKDGVSVANNPGYEQGERATYIYIADKYSITTTAGAITDAEGDKITATQITSDLDGYNKYVLSGSIGDAGAYFEGESDDTKRFKNTTLIVPYTDANGAEYSQHLYATVMPNPVSANAMTAAYNGGALVSAKPREANAFLRADGSTGTVASGTNIGNYAYLDNPVYVGGLCGYAFVNNASNSGGTYLVTGGPNGGGTGVNKAGSFAVLYQSQGTGGNSRTQNVTNSDSAVVTAHYYLDLSKLNDNGTQNIGGLTVNQNDKTLSFNMLGTELNGVDNSQTNRTETFSLTTGTVFSWGSHVSTFSTAANSVNNAQTIASGTTMMYDTSVISASYSSYASAAASANQKLTDTATFKRNHNGTSTPYSNANSVIGIEVNVFDKSAIYDRLGDYKSLIQTDYTEETWEALEEALRNATWYCNNYKLFTYDVNGNVVDPASYMNTLSTELTEAAQALFSFDEFQDFKEIYDLAVAVYDNASDETLTSSTAYATLGNALDAYRYYDYTTDGDEITYSNWQTIKDKSVAGEYTGSDANYNNGVTDPGSMAKFNFNKATYELAKAMSEVRSLTEYSDLETSLYGQPGIYNGTYTEGSATGIFESNTDDSGALLDYANGQGYTLDSWVDFDSAYTTAQERSVESGSAASVSDYRQTEYKYLVDESVTVTLYGQYDSDGNLVKGYNDDGTLIETDYTFGLQSTELSPEQLSINVANEKLNNARLALRAIDEDEAYQNYNAAQELATLADIDAYNTEGQAAINSNFSKGYVLDNGNSYAAEYTDSANAVYVTYNGNIYKNTALGETDAYTTNVLNTLNTTSNLNKYKVYFNVLIDGDPVVDNQLVEEHFFGESVVFDGSAYSDYDIAKWEVKSANTITSIISETAYSIEREIQQDTTVSLYLTTPIEGKTKVSVIDYFGTSLDIGYVDLDENDSFVYSTDSDNNLVYVDANGRTHTVAVNEAENYDFTGWYWMHNDDGGITVIQRATKNLPNGTYEVINGTVNGETKLENVQINTILTFTTDIENFYAWIKTEKFDPADPASCEWYVASYDAEFSTLSRPAGVTFMAISADNIYKYFDADSTEQILASKIPFSFGTATETVTLNGVEKFRLYCDYTSAVAYAQAGNNIQIVQYGVLAAKGDSAPADFTKGAAGVTTAVANADSDYGTYTMTTSVNSATNIYLRSFVSYMYIDPNTGTEIPRVAYGPVVCCDSDGNITK